jgi:predicted small lipoprotein YifL
MKFPPGAHASVLAASAALLLGGCGQKGPLYLPEKGGAVVKAPAGTTPPAPVPSGQPVAPSPTAQPQSTAEPPSPAGTTAPPKKSGPDDDQNPK